MFSRKKGDAMKTACAGLKAALSVAKEVAANVAVVPGLAAGLTALGLVVDTIQKTSQNSEDIDSLAARIETLISILTTTSTSSPEVARGMEKLSSTLHSVSKELNSHKARHWMHRALMHDDDSAWLKSQIDRINECIISLQTVAILRLDSTVTDIQRVIQQTFPKVGYLPRANRAAFHSQEREPCADSTRTTILEEVFGWIDDKSDTPIFWLKGSAGTGKSTIAYTRCRGLPEERHTRSQLFLLASRRGMQ
ncbi:hypothetical protein B0H14DRAFT_1244726 [Mycena olivaceomarginata]|nr:hypothetical protein B0H14DRAFT_1244726 [Mycena olivaceomarginata]